jgi:trehalose/maltose hydrolase-like predicted phosphorylase
VARGSNQAAKHSLDRYKDARVREFGSTFACDVADVQGGTTREGIRLGAIAGTVDIVQRGYMGLVARDDCLWSTRACPMR